MTRSLLIVLLLFLVILPAFSQTGQIGKSSFYVSPAGNDGWSGTLAQPNSSRSDGLFAAIEHAGRLRTFGAQG